MYNYIKNLVLLLLFSCIHWYGSGQTTRTVEVDLGWERSAFQDYGHSKLIYTGNNSFFGLFTGKNSVKRDSEFRMNYSNSTLEPKNVENSFRLLEVKRTRITGSHSFLTRVYHNKIEWYVGTSEQVLYDYANYNNNSNNPVSYELSISIHPKVQVDYPLNSHIAVHFTSDFPLLSYTVRPGSNGLFPTENLDVNMKEIILSGQFKTLNKFYSVHTQISVDFTTNKRKNIELFYEYNGGVNKAMEKKAIDQQRLGISILLFNKTKQS